MLAVPWSVVVRRRVGAAPRVSARWEISTALPALRQRMVKQAVQVVRSARGVMRSGRQNCTRLEWRAFTGTRLVSGDAAG
ncbi:hypothetical protein GCM10009780_14270 [Actinomadura alba]